MKLSQLQLLILSFFLLVQVNTAQATRIYSNIFQVSERGGIGYSKKQAGSSARTCAKNKAHVVCTNMGQSTKILTEGADDCHEIKRGQWTCRGSVSLQCWQDVYGNSANTRRRPAPIRNYSEKDKVKGYKSNVNTPQSTTSKGTFDQSMRQINQDIQQMMGNLRSGHFDQQQYCRTISNLANKLKSLQRDAQTSKQAQNIESLNRVLSQLKQTCR